MSVSKRVRYEVLRRDGHTCRYCGGKAPEVRLTVDHVIPTALGGTDAPDNLVASCADCNAGKTSTHPDSPLVAQVAQDAVRWSEAMQVVAERRSAAEHLEQDYTDAFLEHWGPIFTGPSAYAYGQPVIPADWRRSVIGFYRAGLPVETMVTALVRAQGNRKIPNQHVFRYFAGTCWRMLEEMREEALALLLVEGADE